MEKKINLEEILLDVVVGNNNSFDIEIEYKITQDVLLAMKEACRQVLKLAAKNVFYEEMLSEETDSGCTYVAVINRDSIINTINQVK